MTRALLLSTYVKFVNLFPEVKSVVQDVFRQHSNLRSADAELQQRASEYLQLSIIASTDVLVSSFTYYRTKYVLNLFIEYLWVLLKEMVVHRRQC